MELENDTKVILISSDGEKIEISAKAAMRSTLIKDSIQDCRDDIIEFTANNVKGNILKKIVEYLEHYKDTENPERLRYNLYNRISKKHPFSLKNFHLLLKQISWS